MGVSARAEESGGWLREKIKKRVLKRLEEKEAPASVVVTDAKLLEKITQPGFFTYSILDGGRLRFYKLYVPKRYDTNKFYSLVVALHGGGGDMEIQSTDKYYKLISTADREDFVVLFPNGYSKFKSGKLGTWNAGKCCASARDEKIDDVGFIRKAVSNVQSQIKIDSKKVFATGMSNGAMMAYRLACEASDLFRAIAPVAGTDNTEKCQPAKGVSVLHIHSLKDEHVKFTGGRGDDAVAEEFITDFVSVPATVEKWVKLNGCQRPLTRRLAVKNAYCDEAVECRDGAIVRLCVTEDGGHSWPGGSKPLRRGPSPSKAIDATELAWKFFNSGS